MKQKIILGVVVNDVTFKEALEFIVTGLKNESKKLSIFTPNPENIVYASKHPEFKRILNTADLALADGIGVITAGKLLGKPFKERVTGVDFMEKLCELATENGFRIGLLGGKPKIAERAAECLLEKFPKLKIGLVASEWNEGSSDFQGKKYEVRSMNYEIKKKTLKNSKNRDKKVLEESDRNDIVSQRIDILFVAFGFPKQEQWIYDNLPKIPVRCAMAVGGSFDYISGNVPRAPKFLRDVGLEWLFRLLIEPWRLRRQLALLEFVWLVLKEKAKLR